MTLPACVTGTRPGCSRYRYVTSRDATCLRYRYAAVLLSQLSRYYEVKFVILVWLMFFEGADKIYRSVRRARPRVAWSRDHRNQRNQRNHCTTIDPV